MTDRPALAEALGHAVDQWLETMPGTSVPEIVFARVLAEHETELEQRLAQAIKLQRLTEDNEIQWMRKHEVAEARCAQLEQERDWELAGKETAYSQNSELREQLSAIQAEHERLRAALESIRGHCICGAALAPSQEPIK